MKAKLTLTIENEVVKQARLYAKKTGQSLSEIVENYLQSLTEEQVLPHRLSKIVGIVKLPEGFDEKAALDACFREKHL